MQTTEVRPDQAKVPVNVRKMVQEVLCKKDNAEAFHHGNAFAHAFNKALNT